MLQSKSSGFPKQTLTAEFGSHLSRSNRARFYTLKVQKLLLSPLRMQGEPKGKNSVESNRKESWQDLLSKGVPPSKRGKRNTLGEMQSSFHLL